jgi:hypothetical protein
MVTVQLSNRLVAPHPPNCMFHFHYRTLSDELDVGWVKCDGNWEPFVEQMVEER